MRAERPHDSAASRLTVPLLIGLVAAVVVVSAVLAYEAYRARHSMRITADRAMAQYATMAGWELDAAVRARADRSLGDLFAAVLGGVSASPVEPSPDPAVLLPRASALGVSCAGRPSVLRLELAGERVTIAGAPIAAAISDSIRVGIQQQLRSTSAAQTRFFVPYSQDGRDAFAAVGVRTARFNVPVAAYAIPDCRGVLLRTSVADALRHDPLLPAGVLSGLPNDSLMTVDVREASQSVDAHSANLAARTAALAPRASPLVPSEAPIALTAVQPLRTFPGVTARVSLRPGVRSVLFVSPPERSRLPLLVGLLALCVVLALVALIQLRREHELARLRTDFTSSVSHELRTPLAQILLFGETLSLGRARSDEERTLAATSIVREARRLMHMVENVLHFSRRRDAPDVRLEPLALTPYLADVVSSFAPLATVASMHIELHSSDAVVQADPAVLRQVLLNLLDNAVKYGRPGQTISIGAERIDAEHAPENGSGPTRLVRLTVTDQGPGIAPSDRERVWSPYVRLMQDGQPRRAGSGIGLSVVRELVEAMRGRTWIEGANGSNNASGARFVVELPSP
ncbi:MAG TPA: HAMP domain-containing sensor histidine kinase [Gemmatimonadaceae bacterium]